MQFGTEGPKALQKKPTKKKGFAKLRGRSRSNSVKVSKRRRKKHETHNPFAQELAASGLSSSRTLRTSDTNDPPKSNSTISSKTGKKLVVNEKVASPTGAGAIPPEKCPKSTVEPFSVPFLNVQQESVKRNKVKSKTSVRAQEWHRKLDELAESRELSPTTPTTPPVEATTARTDNEMFQQCKIEEHPDIVGSPSDVCTVGQLWQVCGELHPTSTFSALPTCRTLRTNSTSSLPRLQL
mmetsp:Transcript_11378/g.12492  ORF Transcript_11378/g.12492 Transcript_11378/m.12492 type:complete len:238 (-) Transcript_11378:104-817(-)